VGYQIRSIAEMKQDARNTIVITNPI